MAKNGLKDLHDPDHTPKTIPGAMIKAAHGKLHDEDFEPMTIAGSLVKMAHAEFDYLMEPKNSSDHHHWRMKDVKKEKMQTNKSNTLSKLLQRKKKENKKWIRKSIKISVNKMKISNRICI